MDSEGNTLKPCRVLAVQVLDHRLSGISISRCKEEISISITKLPQMYVQHFYSPNHKDESKLTVKLLRSRGARVFTWLACHRHEGGEAAQPSSLPAGRIF